MLTAYLCLLAGAGIVTAFAYLRLGEPFWYAAGEVAATFALVWLVLADAYPGMRPGAVWVAPAVLGMAAGWQVLSARRDLGRIGRDPVLRGAGRGARIAAAVVTLLLLAPALLAGVRLSARAF